MWNWFFSYVFNIKSVPIIEDKIDMYISHHEPLFCEEIVVKWQFKLQASLKAGELFTLATGWRVEWIIESMWTWSDEKNSWYSI